MSCARPLSVKHLGVLGAGTAHNPEVVGATADVGAPVAKDEVAADDVVGPADLAILLGNARAKLARRD